MLYAIIFQKLGDFGMAKVKATTILEEFIDFLVEKATPESILAFKTPDTLSRIEHPNNRS